VLIKPTFGNRAFPRFVQKDALCHIWINGFPVWQPLLQRSVTVCLTALLYTGRIRTPYINPRNSRQPRIVVALQKVYKRFGPLKIKMLLSAVVAPQYKRITVVYGCINAIATTQYISIVCVALHGFSQCQANGLPSLFLVDLYQSHSSPQKDRIAQTLPFLDITIENQVARMQRCIDIKGRSCFLQLPNNIVVNGWLWVVFWRKNALA